MYEFVILSHLFIESIQNDNRMEHKDSNDCFVTVLSFVLISFDVNRGM